MKKRVSLIIFTMMACVFAFLITGCGTVAHVEKDETVNFARYKTYSWVSEKSLKERNSNHLIDKHVKEAVDRELQKNGLVESKSGAEILIDYNIMVENTVRESDYPVYSRPFMRYYYNPITRNLTRFYYPSQMMGFERSEIPYKEGTITIHMIDNKTDRLVWQGWTTDEVNSRNLTSKEINSSVRTILKKFNPNRQG
jgi:hypothetical protein